MLKWPSPRPPSTRAWARRIAHPPPPAQVVNSGALVSPITLDHQEQETGVRDSDLADPRLRVGTAQCSYYHDDHDCHGDRDETSTWHNLKQS